MGAKYDLEERTFQFANECRILVKSLKYTTANVEDGKQLIKSSGSVGANYIEANEKLGDRDFVFRLKIARKEAKESRYWLRLLKEANPGIMEFKKLINESEEITKILSTIIKKFE
ncbi:four helix bundle protein [Aequorivita sp. 609]|uniref:four helix bundle protein n=1 Tax=Aequorivita TaxID=153265 RepID=UPI0016210AC6|nr:four helix bundle protein [Aequorivita sinensis]MBB6681122.1 four helix bundle protein [Aequorivita sp. 609]